MEKLMNNTIPGIHHITAICGDAQQNIDFYAGILGLRMVKQTVNFDMPDTYHLYYGEMQSHLLVTTSLECRESSVI
jgi:glyoxalase family protein